VPGIDWLELAVRWIHVIAGIAWIGTSFYFIRLNAVLAPAEIPADGVEGEAWSVHGGGFYRSRSIGSRRARCRASSTGSWEAYATWLGAPLLVLVYYLGRGRLPAGPEHRGHRTGDRHRDRAGSVCRVARLRAPLPVTLDRAAGLFAALGLALATPRPGALPLISGRASYMHAARPWGRSWPPTSSS
jgi:hypothetical protein